MGHLPKQAEGEDGSGGLGEVVDVEFDDHKIYKFDVKVDKL